MSWKHSLKGLERTLTLSAQIKQIDTLVNMLTKRKNRLLKRMGIGKDGERITKKEEN